MTYVLTASIMAILPVGNASGSGLAVATLSSVNNLLQKVSASTESGLSRKPEAFLLSGDSGSAPFWPRYGRTTQSPMSRWDPKPQRVVVPPERSVSLSAMSRSWLQVQASCRSCGTLMPACAKRALLTKMPLASSCIGTEYRLPFHSPSLRATGMTSESQSSVTYLSSGSSAPRLANSAVRTSIQYTSGQVRYRRL